MYSRGDSWPVLKNQYINKGGVWNETTSANETQGNVKINH